MKLILVLGFLSFVTCSPTVSDEKLLIEEKDGDVDASEYLEDLAVINGNMKEAVVYLEHLAQSNNILEGLQEAIEYLLYGIRQLKIVNDNKLEDLPHEFEYIEYLFAISNHNARHGALGRFGVGSGFGRSSGQDEVLEVLGALTEGLKKFTLYMEHIIKELWGVEHIELEHSYFTKLYLSEGLQRMIDGFEQWIMEEKKILEASS